MIFDNFLLFDLMASFSQCAGLVGVIVSSITPQVGSNRIMGSFIKSIIRLQYHSCWKKLQRTWITWRNQLISLGMVWIYKTRNIFGAKVFLNLSDKFWFFLMLEHNLRDNPRYMAGEFLSEALQNIEDFKFTEVWFLIDPKSRYNYRPLIILRKQPMKQWKAVICPQVLKDF